MRIVGLDISRGKAAACLISEIPEDYVEAYHTLDIPELPADRWGLAELLAMNPDAIAIEPTGKHYAKLWADTAAAAGIKIYWVGHEQLASFRNEIGIKDKTDPQDAFALACYLWRAQFEYRQFIRVREPVVAELRALGLRLQHLDRCRNPHINHLRQLLAWQFPEAAQAGLQRSDGKPSALLNFIADGEGSNKWARAYSQTCGMGLQPEAVFEAQCARNLCFEECRAMERLRELLASPEFDPYRRVFNSWRIPPKSQAILISQIYPLSDFLGPDGRPIVRKTKGKEKPSKKTKKHLSRRRFEKTIGCAPREKSSGKKEGKTQHVGSALCRKHIWLWLLQLERKARPLNLSDPDAIAVRERLNSLKAAGVPAPLARGRVAGDAARKLFYRLIQELQVHGKM